jgi:hypothetical protein
MDAENDGEQAPALHWYEEERRLAEQFPSGIYRRYEDTAAGVVASVISGGAVLWECTPVAWSSKQDHAAAVGVALAAARIWKRDYLATELATKLDAELDAELDQLDAELDQLDQLDAELDQLDPIEAPRGQTAPRRREHARPDAAVTTCDGCGRPRHGDDRRDLADALDALTAAVRLLSGDAS